MRLRRPIIVLAALAATALIAPSASWSHSSVTTAITGAPDPVTVGHTAAFTTTFSNGNVGKVGNVESRVQWPDGASFVDAIPSTGACELDHAHTVECEFGQVQAGGEVSVTVLIRAPSAAGSLAVSARWSGEGEVAQTSSATIGVVAPTRDKISEWALPQGDTVTTDPGSGATKTNPQVTTADVPATEIGTATELSEADAAPGQFCAPYAPCFGQVSTITIGQTFSPGDPLRFVFLLDKSEIPKHTKIKTIPMYHDSVAVPNCTGGSGVASPDPCVVTRKKVKKCDVQIVVLSSTNGRWRP